ncbi:MAG: TRAP transporter substrate-binding protein [Victivallales bacterium]|nr:TRAP transporter substrate-binding protein [Victivallales bacterium]
MKLAYHLHWLLLAVLLFAGCGGNDPNKPIRLTYSIFFPSTHVHSVLAKQWADELEARTNGRVHVDIFYGSTLTAAGKNFDGVVFGLSDLGMSCFAYSGGVFPLSEGLDLPLGYPDGRTATIIANEYLEKFHPQELEEAHMLYIHAHGPGVVASTAPVRSIDDIHKLKAVRGTGITARVVKSLGGNAVGLPQGDTYEALRKGVVQGTLCPIETLKGWKQGEAIEHVVKVPSIGYTTAMYVVMNKKRWESLPKDIQDIINQLNREWIPKHGAAWDQADKDGYRFIKELGKEYTQISPEEDQKAAKLLQPMLEKWADQAEKRGVPGHELIQFIQERIHALADDKFVPPYPFDLEQDNKGN